MRQSLLLFVLVTLGCSATRQGVPPLPSGGLHPDYRIGCPDLLDVTFPAAPVRDVAVAVDIDGRLPVEGLGQPRVEGLTVTEARLAIAAAAEVSPADVKVTVVEPRSSTVVVTGPDNRRSQFLRYTGPEPVLDFLRRSGTIPPGSSKLNRVYVLRSNVAAGTPLRLYHVDVDAALLDGDNATNLPLEPGDQVYIGETRRSSISRLLPDWMKPLYRKLVGLLPDSLR